MASSASRQVDPASVRCVECGKPGTKGKTGHDGDVYPRAGPRPPRCSKCTQRRKNNGACPRCDRSMYRKDGQTYCNECTAEPFNVVDQFRRGPPGGSP